MKKFTKWEKEGLKELGLNEKEFNQLKLHEQKVVLTALKEFGHE